MLLFNGDLLMGTPLPPDPAGVHCENCFGLDGPLYPDQTPLYVYITFDNLQPTQAGKLFYDRYLISPVQLTQRGAYPCEYIAYLSGLTCHLRWRHVGPQFLLFGIQAFPNYFTGLSTANCQTEFVNENVEGDGNRAFGGTAKVTWGT